MSVPQFKPKVFLLVPTMACQAGCRYCYARKSGERMSMETAAAAIDFIACISAGQRIMIIFHGGEPLLAGQNFYEKILPMLRDRFGRRARFAMQSNLWAMTDALAELFSAYEVEIGTSIDGFPEMCDGQRGQGYYEKTMAGAAVLASHGKQVGRICTFTADHTDDARRVFLEAETPYTIHGAIPAYGACANGLTLTPDRFTQILRDTYHIYRENPDHTRVGLIDSMASAVLHKKAGLCTFSACLGQYAAITPYGDVYSCQRFSGISDFCLGNIRDGLSEEKILTGKAYQLLAGQAERMKTACADCMHFPYCNGGCLYSALTGKTEKDPYCGTYKAVFDEILTDMGREIPDVMLQRDAETPVLAMAGDRPHPYEERVKRERVLKALDQGKTKVSRTGKISHPENQLNKIFFNLTRRCPLRCSHCWAGGRDHSGTEMDPERVAVLIAEAASMRFRHIILTGGEPLVYRGFDRLMELIGGIDRKGAELVLRTSFAFPIPDARMKQIAECFDRIIVSVDGGRACHDARRGPGTYARTVSNLETFIRQFGSAKLGLWSVLEPEKRWGGEGQAVLDLGKRLGISYIHFDGMKPMGNACHGECDTAADLPERAADLRVRTNCGLGHILHVEPDGKAYPCYVCMTPGTLLADLSREPLSSLREKLLAYAETGVETNEKCSSCEVRYVCGGLCLIYRPHPDDPDSGDFDCEERRTAIQDLLKDLIKPDHLLPGYLNKTLP